MQVQTELRRKLRSWRTETQTVCCGKWLAVPHPRADTFSIATVPDCSRSSVSVIRTMPDVSPTNSSQILHLGHPVQPSSPKEHALLMPSFSPLKKRENTMQLRDQEETEHASVEMQVAFLIHLKDPVELLPHVVNKDSDWIDCHFIYCTF